MKYILILEDNRRAREKLAKELRELGGNVAVLEAETVEQARNYMFEYRINVFILDIVLVPGLPGDISGMRFAQNLRGLEIYLFTPIIFISALEDPKLYAFRNLRSFGYLEKPYAMQEALEQVSLALRHPVPEEKVRMEYFRKDGILIAVDLKKVIYVEVCCHMFIIHIEEEVLEIPYITIRRFLKQCRSENFFQCSRSVVVNREYIASIDLPRRYIQLKNGERVEIGPAFADQVRPGKKAVISNSII